MGEREGRGLGLDWEAGVSCGRRATGGISQSTGDLRKRKEGRTGTVQSSQALGSGQDPISGTLDLPSRLVCEVLLVYFGSQCFCLELRVPAPATGPWGRSAGTCVVSEQFETGTLRRAALSAHALPFGSYAGHASFGQPCLN